MYEGGIDILLFLFVLLVLSMSVLK